MSDAMEALFAYAQEHRLPAYLYQDENYMVSAACAEKQEALVRAALAKRDRIHLEDLLAEMEIEQCARDRAAFRCGFRLAMELGRT